MAGKLPHKRYFTGNESRAIALWEIFVKGIYSAPGRQRRSSLGKGSSRVVNCFCVPRTRGRPTAWWYCIFCVPKPEEFGNLLCCGDPIHSRASRAHSSCAAEKWRFYRSSCDTCEPPPGLWALFSSASFVTRFDFTALLHAIVTWPPSSRFSVAASSLIFEAYVFCLLSAVSRETARKTV